MISELDPLNYGRIAPIFRGRRQIIPALSVLEGNHPGRVFVDSAENPRTAYVWVFGRWAYVGGASEQIAFLQSLPDLITDSISIEVILREEHCAIPVCCHSPPGGPLDAQLILNKVTRIEWLEMPALPLIIR